MIHLGGFLPLPLMFPVFRIGEKSKHKATAIGEDSAKNAAKQFVNTGIDSLRIIFFWFRIALTNIEIKDIMKLFGL